MMTMAGAFTNDPIEITEMPILADETFQPLAPGYLRSKYVGDAISAVVIIVGGGIATAGVRAGGGPLWLPAVIVAFLLALVVLTAVLQTLSVRHLGFLVREHDLTFRRGVISRTTQTIPYNRVQHVGVDRGPVEIRILDIALLPEYRGRGIGTAMLEELLTEARESGVPVRMHVERSNPAQSLYTRLGFEPVEERGLYYLLEWRG